MSMAKGVGRVIAAPVVAVTAVAATPFAGAIAIVSPAAAGNFYDKTVGEMARDIYT